jgi:HSP20 family molecular chaperone IbpA
MAPLAGTYVPIVGRGGMVGFEWKSQQLCGGIMSKLPVQHRPRSFFPSELFEGFPSWTGLRPVFGNHIIRVEDETKDGNYEVRAEIPGIDPAKDVDITVRDGLLTIKAERTEKRESNGRSEFSYGSFIRTVTLPPGADEDAIKASYDKGILTVSVPVSQAQAAEKHVAVETAK